MGLTLYSFLLLIAGSLTGFIALLIFLRLERNVRWFGCLMLAIAHWAVAYGFELTAKTLPQMLFWINLEYIGIAFLPAIWMLAILKFFHKQEWLNPRNKLLLFAIPLITLLMVWTNPWHHLHYEQIAKDIQGELTLLVIKPGPWYWVHTAYFYLSLIWGTCLLFVQFKKAGTIYKKQIAIILTGAIIPWLANLVYQMDFRPLQHIDITPYAFILTALVISFGLFHFKLFDIVPIAREKVFEVMEEGVMVINNQGRIIDLNPEMQSILSSYTSVIIGMESEKLFDQQSNLLQKLNKRINDKLEITLKEGPLVRYFEVIITPIFEKDRKYSGSVLLFRNITSRKLSEEKLQDQTQELVELNQLKDRLFAIISHDLRSPLLSLMHVLRMTDEGLLSEEEFKTYLPQLSKNIDYTSNLVENLLYWSRTQLHGESINPEHFKIKDIIDNKINLFTKNATEKGIRLEKDVPDDLHVYADVNMIQLVVRNLLVNAIKFSKKDGIIKISAEAGQEYTTVCVSDTGIGMTKEDLSKVFGIETFTQRGTSNEKGTGLGILLCIDFVEKNHGMIWAESKPGHGSQFYFTIPNDEAPNTQTPATSSHSKLH
ncbi:histidine kinase N-terminal 7TM domain-containing protein [Rapidithrix thailandica]|uniref:histidine kinase n=1 Tax=Rapidithrix thailandica TaxID=413964 RepID=A0AAW9S763_9BACT